MCSNIVTVRDFCKPDNNHVSLSGYDLMDAPEITTNRISGALTEHYTQVRPFLLHVVKTEFNDLKNDFLSVISANGFAADLIEKKYQTGEFSNKPLPAANFERGFTLYKVNKKGNSLKSLRINTLFINSLEQKDSVNVRIYDGNTLVTVTVRGVVVGINEFNINYKVQSNSARIVLPSNELQVASTPLTCFVGCNGTKPNDCAYTKGFNNGDVSVKEGYGLNVNFSCFCDYESILCDLSTSYTGKLLYLKARMRVLQEIESSDRLNHIVIYGKDDAARKRAELQAEYNQTWNTLVQGLPNILKGYCGDCIQCNKIKYVTNV